MSSLTVFGSDIMAAKPMRLDGEIHAMNTSWGDSNSAEFRDLDFGFRRRIILNLIFNNDQEKWV